MLNVIRLMQEMGLSIEEIDALTGQAVGMAAVGDVPHHRHGWASTFWVTSSET